MKRKILLIITFMFMVLLTACSSNTNLKSLKYSEFQKMISNKETFIVEVSQDGCSHCASFTPKFEDVLNKNNITAYNLNLSNMAKAERDEFNNNYNVEGTPTVMFFKDGEESSLLNRIEGDKDTETIVTKLKNNGYIK